MTRDEALAKLHDSQVQLLLHTRKFSATQQLYDSACFARDGVAAQRYRDELHATLDLLLDTVACAMALTRQFIEQGN